MRDPLRNRIIPGALAVFAALLLFLPTAPAQEATPALQLPWTAPSGQGVALSYETGAFGVDWQQGLKLQIPFGLHFAMNLRPMVLVELHGLEPSNAVAVGGRLELIGRTPVYLNLIRLYGGGGGGPFVNLSGPATNQVTVEGGGQFGFECFLSPHLSFYAEIGANGCSAGAALCSGATVVAGVSAYP